MSKRIVGWIVSLVLGLILTWLLFEFTAVAIPFLEGGAFTAFTVILFAVLISYLLDSLMSAGLYDEGGAHLGLFDPMGPLADDDPPPPDDYQPIPSRTDRLKQQSKA